MLLYVIILEKRTRKICGIQRLLYFRRPGRAYPVHCVRETALIQWIRSFRL